MTGAIIKEFMRARKEFKEQIAEDIKTVKKCSAQLSIFVA